MKLSIPLIALSIWCAPALAATASQGSKVVVPPLITTVPAKPSFQAVKPTVVRLPTQVGKVSKVVTTNLTTKGPAIIAKGDKYLSLCLQNRAAFSCAPIVATIVMKGVEVGAMAGNKGEPVITFKLEPGVTPKRAAYAMTYFLTRIHAQAKRLDRMAVSYALGKNSLVVGGGSGGGGGSCTWDDDGMLVCTGGGLEPGGTEGSGGSCTGTCTYPPSNNNGNEDPCIDPNGNRICNSPSDIPSIPVPGERPADVEPMGCKPVAGGLECSWGAPIPPIEQLPKGPAPWFSQSTCNDIPFLCSKGQEPEKDNDRGDDSSTSGKTKDELYDLCDKIATREYAVCEANKAMGADSRTTRACNSRVETRRSACYTTARELTDNGKHVAP